MFFTVPTIMTWTRIVAIYDQLREIERHVDPRIGAAERLAVEIDTKHPVQLAVAPPRRYWG